MIRIRERRFGPALIAVFFAGILSPCLSAEPLAPKPPIVDTEGEALKSTVVFRIRQNYFRLPSVRCKQITTILDATVAKREVIREKTDKGATIEFTRSPKTVSETELILVKDNMRADSLDKETNDRWSASMHNDIWTIFTPSRDFARRKYREEMGGEGNIDPRNVGVFEQRKNVLTELKGCQVERHETARRDGSEKLVLFLSRSFPKPGLPITTRYEFDPAQNYLPSRIIGEDPESKEITWVQDIEYQEVLSKSAWFLKKSRLRFFADKKPESPCDDCWTQQITAEIVGPVRTDEPIADDAFEIQLPPGINYIDQTIGRERPASQP